MNREQHPDWDARTMGCGELVVQLKLRLRDIEPGGVFHLVASDPGAREDIPAWCRLTGNTLVAADHPTYLIERRSE